MLPWLEEVKRRRKLLGMTQHQLSKEAEVSQSAVTKIERGRIVPSYEIARKIFDTLESLEQKEDVKAGEKMSRKILSLSPSDSIKKAAELMKDHDISQIPILDDDNPVGSITESLILYSGAEKSQTVSSIMQEPFPLISENASITAIKALLRENPAILLQKGQRLTGIITKADLL